MAGDISSFEVSLSNPLIYGLACAALNSGSQSILVFDTPPKTLRLLADIMSQMLRIVRTNEVVLVQLNTVENEDDLWGKWTVNPNAKSLHDNESLSYWQPGLLESEHRLKLVFIPDLARLSLTSMRAYVSLSEGIAHLERHGKKQSQQSNICWLAGCKQDDIGMVSPHVLDRFSLRLLGWRAAPHDRAGDILNWLKDEPSTQKYTIPKLSMDIVRKLQAARKVYPKFASSAIRRVLDYTSDHGIYSPRREIALLKMATAHTRLELKQQVESIDVDIVASVIGLKLQSKSKENHSFAPSDLPEFVKPELEQNEELIPQTAQSDQLKLPIVSESAYASPQIEESLPIVINPPIPISLYPEDTAEVQREASSLRFPHYRFQAKGTTRGPIIGVKPSTTLHDLALISTLLEAAKFQPVRKLYVASNQAKNSKLILSSTDLRSYRRTPVAEQMLTVVLDHTCVQNCMWLEALLPYLRGAYVERASVCLVQVGNANASNELRAERILERNILVPSINRGLEAGWGKATPLAHGLDLALQTLRHALQHGRNHIYKATLLVISDGRGNVPLVASQTGRIILPVQQQGVESALQVAEQIRALDRLEVILLNPRPKHHPDLPIKLARSLGAKVLEISPLEALKAEVK